MLTITVNGKEITISDIMAGQVCKHYDNRYSLKIGFETNTVLSEYDRECVGRKLTGLAAENDRLKQDFAALTDVKRIADNLVEMERINRMGDMADEIKRLKAKLNKIEERCNTPIHVTYDQFGGGMASGYNILKKYILEIIKESEAV